VFRKLRIDRYELRINSRKLLASLAEKCGGSEKLTDITIAIDKLDKIGMEKVKNELHEKSITDADINIIEKYLSISGDSLQKIDQVKTILGNSPDAQKGIHELEFILNNTKNKNLNLELDFTLARGLNYYTGIIFEAKAPSDIQIGSIGGGGRYDDLTGLFGVPNIAGVGISFGVDRIYDVMEEMNLFPEEVMVTTRVMFLNSGEKESEEAIEIMQALRKRNISCEMYYENSKVAQQFKYAENKNIPFVVTLNATEKTAKVKDIRTGKLEILPLDLKSFLSFNF